MNFVYPVLLLTSIWLAHLIAGGTRLLYAIPAYAVLGIAGLFAVRDLKKLRTSPRWWCLVPMAVFALYVIGRGLFSEVHFLARNDIFLMLACTLVYLLTAFFITDTRERLIVFAGLFALATLHIVVGLVQFGRATNEVLFGLLGVREGWGRRASGLYVNPNHCAAFLESIALIALSLMWWSRLTLRQKILCTYVAVSCLCGVALTASRGGYLSSVIGLSIFGVATLWTVRKIDAPRFPISTIYVGVGVLVVSLGVLFLQTIPALNYRLQEIGTEDIRQYNWEAALDQFGDSPVFGTGAGSHVYMGRFYRRSALQTDPQHAHNDYLELLAEYGAVGFISMLAFVGMHIFSGVRTAIGIARERLAKFYVTRSNSFALEIGLLCAMASMAVHSFLDFNLHVPGNALVFAFFFGILANPDAEHDQTPVESRERVFRFAVPALAVALLIGVIARAPGEYFTERARMALRDRLFGEAIDFANRALRHDAKNANTYFYLGEAHRAVAMIQQRAGKTGTSEYQLAVEAYKKGLAVYPEDEWTMLRMAQALDGLKRYEEAEQFYKAAIARDPNLKILHTLYADHLKMLGRKTEAENEYEMGRE